MRVDLASSGVEPPDKATFSFEHTWIESLEAQVLALPEIRRTKVHALKQAIGNGAYSVAPAQIANAMVADLLG
jgi:flagellar biosynthesis anti-sigma factor FlgM